MMYLLTELVRLLEQRGHIFPADPILITERLRHAPEPTEARLHRRAAEIDADGNLNARLHRYRHTLRLLLAAAVLFWFVGGFATAYGLMQQSSLNFLFILGAVLGINTLMLLWWLLSLLLRRPQMPFWLDPALLLRGRDQTTQAVAELYAGLAKRPEAVWHIGAVSHRLAFAALAGMFAAVLLLLTVRQYGFNWESTLLDGQTFERIVRTLAWLPEKLGFPTPDAAAVSANRNRADPASATGWAGLLLGSIICYGLLPRAAAWLACRYGIRRRPLKLDLHLPYYQAVLAVWQRRITDRADNYRSDIPPAPAPVTAAPFDGLYWAVCLDAPDVAVGWFDGMDGKLWQDKGSVSGREQAAQLLTDLSDCPEAVRLLVCVRAAAAADRGTVRLLTKLAAHTKGGLILHLHDADRHPETAAQWQHTAAEYGWPIV